MLASQNLQNYSQHNHAKEQRLIGSDLPLMTAQNAWWRACGCMFCLDPHGTILLYNHDTTIDCTAWQDYMDVEQVFAA